MQETYVMLKPGVLQRRLVGELIARFEAKGLTLRAIKLSVIPRALAEQHYAEHREKPFFGELVDYITSGPVVAMVWRGVEAIELVRTLVGATRVHEAQPGTIRGDFAHVTTKNIVHASDSPAGAQREIGLFFRPEELIDWDDPLRDWTR